MENKYFTPSLEDIRVGYECEICPNLGFDDNWVKVVGRCEEIPGNGVKDGNLDDLTYDCLVDGYIGIRVPYLTKEQIEAEGWEFVESNKSINILTFKIIINDHSWYELDYFTDSKTLIITKYYIHGDEDLGLYNGECKDINTFRYITKLLRI